MFKKKNNAIIDDDMVEPLTRLTNKLYKAKKKQNMYSRLGRICMMAFGFAFGFSLSALTITSWGLHTTIIAAVGLPLIIPTIYSLVRYGKLTKEIVKLELDINKREREDIFDIKNSNDISYINEYEKDYGISQPIEEREETIEEKIVEDTDYNSVDDDVTSSTDDLNV